MSLRIVIDMNISVEWVQFLINGGHDAGHWSRVGNQASSDPEIME
jgi:predicted nuclease of predicted toxin-antitoxin system